MGKKILDSKILYVVLSILISVSLWLYITSRDENRERQPFRNLPITFDGADILEERGLMIVNQDVTANIEVRAAPMVLATLSNDPPQLVAKVSGIGAEGSHTVSFTVIPPAGVSQDDVEIITPLNGNVVTIEVARALRREVEIRGEFKGSAAEGYLAGDSEDFQFSPGTIMISGQAELVNQVAYAKVTVDEENLTDEVSGDYPFQLIGASGDPLKDLNVACDVDMVYTRFPIRATAQVPLEVKVIDGGGLKERDVDVRLSETSIMVAGSREAVDTLVGQGAITLATIDLSMLDDDTVENGSEQTIPVPLTDELENLSGVTEVKLTLKVTKRGVESREFETSRISVINAPEGWRPTVITQAVKVKVRGTKALLDELIEDNILVSADLKDVNQAAGQYTVYATVYLGSAGSATDVGVVNPKGYTVVVSLAPEG